MKHIFKNLDVTKFCSCKAILFSFFFLFSFLVVYSQADSTKNVPAKSDTTKIDLGKKELQIINGPSQDDIEMHLKNKQKHSQKEDEDSDNKSWKSGGFKGHWAGLELGLNNYLNKDHSMSLS
jgi:hypothetical protein